MSDIHEWKQVRWNGGWTGKGMEIDGKVFTLEDCLQSLERDGWEIFTCHQISNLLQLLTNLPDWMIICRRKL